MLLEQHHCEDLLAGKSATRGLNFPEIIHEPNNTNSLAEFTWGFLKPKPPEKKNVGIFEEPQTEPIWGACRGACCGLSRAWRVSDRGTGSLGAGSRWICGVVWVPWGWGWGILPAALCRGFFRAICH